MDQVRQNDFGILESELIEIVVNIYQNVGIKRWIDQISMLKEEQVYFQICRVCFPESMFKLYRLNENSALTTGQKIQGAIDITASVLGHDLYHISGENIARGDRKDIWNFLQLLNELSKTFIIYDNTIDVKSAPAQGTSSDCARSEEHIFYTVIGMEQQFNQEEERYVFEPGQRGPSPQRQFFSENQASVQASDTKESDKDDRSQQYQRQQWEQHPAVAQPRAENNSSSCKESSEGPIPPVWINNAKVKPSKRVEFKMPDKQRKQEYPPKKHTNPSKIQQYQRETYKIIQELEKKKKHEAHSHFQLWLKGENTRLSRSIAAMKKEEEKQMQFFGQRVSENYKILSSMKGQKQALQSIKNLFSKEKKLEKKRVPHQEEMDFCQQAFQRAIDSSNYKYKPHQH